MTTLRGNVGNRTRLTASFSEKLFRAPRAHSLWRPDYCMIPLVTAKPAPPGVASISRVLMVVGALGIAAGCGPESHFYRTDAAVARDDARSGGRSGDGPTDGGASGGSGGGSGGTIVVGTGGVSSGGMTGTGGGAIGSGGMVGGTGGRGTGGVTTGGVGSGGSATGGMMTGTGGMATGGAATGGAGTGGAGTGGAATGGMGTGGANTGGAATGGAGPRILSIDFVGGSVVGGAGGVTAAPAMAASEVAGFKPSPNWNTAPTPMGSLGALRLGDGTNTGAVVAWNSPPNAANTGIWKNRYTDAPGNPRMMNGYLDPTASNLPATVMVTSLPSNIVSAGYDVYVYSAGDIPSASSRTYNYAIGSTTVVITQMGPSTSAFPGFILAPASGGNVAVFRNLRTSSFTLTATTGSGTRAPVCGIQIVSPTGS